MSARDRTMIMIATVAAILLAAWFLVVSPERTKASKLDAQIASAKSQLVTAQGELANAQGAQAKYSAAYESIVTLGKAVPPTQEVPSLIYEISRAADEKNVQFASIGTGSTGGASSSAASAASGASAGFSALPFTFTFEGGFFQLEHLFRQLADFSTLGPAGHVKVSGRLLTVESVQLAPSESAATLSGSKSAGGMLRGAVTATAYVLPPSQGLTGGASAASPAAGASPAPGAAGTSSPTTPAIVKANP